MPEPWATYRERCGEASPQYPQVKCTLAPGHDGSHTCWVRNSDLNRQELVAWKQK